jgi:hypothetical protein
MWFDAFSSGSFLDDVTYERDIVIDRGEARKRKKMYLRIPILSAC